jgi:predicted anti-sigma-YlaC factor YlaD
MTSGTECSRLRILLGVYVLGAIEPAERAMVDAHLGVCGRCRDELASLAGLPAMLGRVTEDQLEQLGPPPEELLDAILTEAADESRGRRRKNRLWLVAAAAALVVVTGVGVRAVSGTDGGTIAKPPPSPAATSPAVTTVNGNDPDTGVRAEIAMQPKEWGTAFSVRLAGAPADSQCRLIAIDKKGRQDVAGGWQVEYLGEASFYGSSMFQKQDIAAVEVRTLDGKRLLHVRV